ncbi:MAG TPA: BREX-2 system adenine-specific DNA-methyltransferase PglX [Polyangiaceae bacterium]
MAAKKKSLKKPQERNLTRELSLLLAKTLLPDLQARAEEPSVARALAAQYKNESKHTADTLAEWTTRTLEQVAVAWILSCVFIRTLEDRGYLTHPRLAGEGAADSEHLFFDLFPSLTQRDYLLAVFRELSHLPGGEEVLAPKHNPAWRLAPTTEGVRTLLAFFRQADGEGKLIWSFTGESTRFLGDLYQDVSEAVRERYALLQTPDFVEEFILDLTLDPAVAEFGLEEVRLIDPTCGSGHFLLGAFKRLFEARQRKAPATPARDHAAAALAQVHGADINPYAAAIARFRLVLAYLQAAGIERLKDAPRISTNVVVADSLLFAADNQTLPFAAMAEDATAWGDRHWQFEEPKEVQRIFSKRFHAVVGNPPYITCKDSVLREEYRRAYASAAGKYALSAPFTERFFQLAIDTGFVGMINANNFMKREFGKALIEKVLPQFELTRVMDTAGAFIPGHSTPTVLLFGRNRPPLKDKVVAVLGKRGEPSTPADPANGLVWSSIRGHFTEPGFDNEFLTVAELDRATLAMHPWSLGGGGAADLKALIEHRASARLGELATLGVGGMSNADDVFICDTGHSPRRGISASVVRALAIGEEVRDWSHSRTIEVYFPYDNDLLLVEPKGSTLRFLWPYRTTLWARATFGGGTYRSDGRKWWQWHQVTVDRYRTPLSIMFAEVASHNHFVLDRGGTVFSRTAPIIKLPETATEEDHLVLLAYLNSSTVCFYLRQVCQQKQMMGGDGIRHADKTTVPYQFGCKAAAEIPVPSFSDPERLSLADLARSLCELAAHRDSLSLTNTLRKSFESTEALLDATRANAVLRADLFEQMVFLQEEIDWLVYRCIGLVENTTVERADGRSRPGARPFEVLLRQSTGVAHSVDGFEIDTTSQTHSTVSRRISAITSNSNLQIVECSHYKRRWIGHQGRFNHSRAGTIEDEVQKELGSVLIEASEAHLARDTAPVTLREIISRLRAHPELAAQLGAFDRKGIDLGTAMQALLQAEAVPFLSVLRFADSGLVKFKQWRATWDCQRAEDTGAIGEPPVPPKYDPKDFRGSSFFRHRGKLDVPNERFVSYPGTERDDDKTPLFGWAGWDHLQQATALAGLYHERKTEDGWPADRLEPLLAGLLELVPWLKQWHNEPNEELGGEGPGDWYERYVEAESRSIGKTLQDLRDWRPAKGRGSKAS